MNNPIATHFLRLFFAFAVLCLSACGGSSGGSVTLGEDAPPAEEQVTPPDSDEPQNQSLFGAVKVPVEEDRAGQVVMLELTSPVTGDITAITLMEPTELKAGHAYPLVLHGHGYGGHRSHAPDALQQRFRDAGYYVISIDQRGFGESSDTVRIMSPDYEGQDLVNLLDWAEALPGLARFADGRMVVGSYGGSYGGMYQYILAGTDPEERLRVIATDMTPYDLEYALASHDVPKTGWAAALTAMGEVPILGLFGTGFPEEFVAFLQKELVGDNTRGELTNQDPVVVESLVRGLVAGRLSSSTKNMLRYHSLRYFCDGEPAGAQDGFILGIGDPLAVPPKPLPKIDALISQGMGDTLFNFNDALNAYQCLQRQGGDVRLITHQSGHILPLSPDLLPDWNENMDWLYAMFRPPEFQKPGGNEHCGNIERFDATFAWFEEKLKGKTNRIDATLTSGQNVCLSLGDGRAAHVETVKKGGEAFAIDVDTPAMSGPFGLLASLSGSLPSEVFMQTQALYSTPKDGKSHVLAGVPVLDVTITSVLGEALTPDECLAPLSQLPLDDIVQGLGDSLPVGGLLGGIGEGLDDAIQQVPLVKDLPLLKGVTGLLKGVLSNVLNLPGWLTNTVDDALPLACDPIYFISLAKRPEGKQRWDIINNQVTPIRGYGKHRVELNGIATLLNPGDEVGILIMGGNLQYPLSFSRDLVTVFATMNGQIELPLLDDSDIVKMDFGEPENGHNGVFPDDAELIAALKRYLSGQGANGELAGAANLSRYLEDVNGGFAPYPDEVPSGIQALADFYLHAAAQLEEGRDKDIASETGSFLTDLAAGNVSGETPRPEFLGDLASVIATL